MPPLIMMTASAARTTSVLRIQPMPVVIATSTSTFASRLSSPGRIPITRPPALFAPRLTASITPERPPVTTTAPRSASSFPTSSPARSARAGTGSPGLRALLPMTVMTGFRVIPSAEPPELWIEREVVEYRLGLFVVEAPPVRVELVLVPGVRERCGLLDREDRRRGRLRAFAPALGMLLRPEEQDRRSGEVDVLPEIPGRHADLHDRPRLDVRGTVGVHLDDDRLAAVAAVRLDDARLAERRRDAERVPGADPEPHATGRGDEEVRGTDAERVVGVDLVRILRRDEDVALDHPRERAVHRGEAFADIRGAGRDRRDPSAGLDRASDRA